MDVAAVGVAFLERAPALLQWFHDRLGTEDREAVLSWFAFWFAVHDLGKFSISFQGQRPDLIETLQGEVPSTLGLPDVRHDSLGMWLWDEDIQGIAQRDGWFGTDPDGVYGLPYWLRAVMGHHGQPPIEPRRFVDRHFRVADRVAALAFVEAARALLLTPTAAAIPADMGADAFETVSQELSWWVAGLMVLSDWIGSSTDFFPYIDDTELPLAEYWQMAQGRARQAIEHCGVLPSPQSDLHAFATLFPRIATPSPLQDWACRVSIDASPQIHLLEDVTGAGKTEAAVMLTHRLMAAGCADGFFIGLPTMATANAMYGRIAQVYDRLFPQPVSLALAHRSKKLVEEFQRSVLPAGVDEHDMRQGDETATRRCTRWLADHNKRALLAPAGVGTIDQALLAALQSKHQSLRLLGLMRKVLVVDEVHACDAYMQRTLELLLEFHARAGGSAVLLSATLTKQMKHALLKAFAKGCGQRRLPAPVRDDYPLVTYWSKDRPANVVESPVPTRAAVQRTVQVRYVSDRGQVIDDIRAELAAGRCVAWIRNTVGDALDAYAELSAHVDPERITLFHARFALGDRLDIEERVLQCFGRESDAVQRGGRLLIATQVAEQSLDIDLDLIVSDLAPIDRLIQRAGRLHRHVRDAAGNPLADGAADQRGAPCLWVLGPEWTAEPEPSWFKKAFPKGAAVYPNHGELWLTAQCLQSGRFTMPDDARGLIETVFGGAAPLPEGLERNATQAEGKAYGDKSLADRNAVKIDDGYQRRGLDWDEDSIAPSRLGEDTIEVLLARWEGDRLLPWRDDRPAPHAWAYSTVRVAKRLIADTAQPTTLPRQAALDATREAFPGGGKWVVLLPLEEVDGVFNAVGTSAAKDGSERITRWRYSAAAGLAAVKD
jgi:CRISPR-associated endonuclease/helicase Cas3